MLFESGAILEYLAARSGKLLGKGAAGRAEVMSWPFWQVGGPGPMFGQAASFSREKPPNRPAYEKVLGESKRLAKVLGDRLEHRQNQRAARCSAGFSGRARLCAVVISAM